jgi:hypothetical protein
VSEATAAAADRFLAATFLSPRKGKPAATPELAELRELLDRQEQTTAEIRAKLEALETART